MLLKDNIDTADRMTTTAGSLALAGSIAPTTRRWRASLREAGAVLLGKTNMSEWANIRSNESSSGWSARGGQCRNPYALDRNPCGSSSGSGAAVAANLCAVGDRHRDRRLDRLPGVDATASSASSPRVGLVSRAGIIPISHSQDTAGPMARTVRDAAILLGALAGADPRDAATADSRGTRARRLHAVPRRRAGSRARASASRRKYFGFHRDVDRLMEEALGRA